LGRQNRPALRKVLTRVLRPLHRVALEAALHTQFAAWMRHVFEHAKVPAAAVPDTEFKGIDISRAYMFQDKRWGERARILVHEVLKDPRLLEPESLIETMAIAAWGGDDELWKTLAGALETQTDPVVRMAIGGALGSFRDPKLFAKSLDLAFTGKLGPQEFESLSRGVHYQNRKVAWRWLTDHYPRLERDFGHRAQGFAAWVGNQFCDQRSRVRIGSFYKGLADPDSRLNRRLERVLANIDRCVRLRSMAEQSFLPWLRQKSFVP
jgi:hypothetical protein